MKTSVLEYLAGLRKYGHQPTRIGEVIIGRTHYAAGEFIDAQRGVERVVLMPMYRSDWVTRESAGPTPNLLPASYTRSRKTTYLSRNQVWYISAWHDGQRTVWLDKADDVAVDYEHVAGMGMFFNESFETAMALAGPEVRARIALG